MMGMLGLPVLERTPAAHLAPLGSSSMHLSRNMEEGSRSFLNKGGRSESAAKRVISYVRRFERHLNEKCSKGLDEADTADLEAFVALIEQKPKASALLH